MNGAHLHVILNHLPVLLIPFAAVCLAHAVKFGNDKTRVFSLAMLILVAGLAVPTYLTGEPAEDIVEKVQGVSEDAIEEHEDAGTFALISSLTVGVAAIGALVLPAGNKRKWATRITLILALWATTVLARTAFLGGQIRHSEFSSTAPADAD